jgi:transcriptional regulator with XRE-family HTH domain
MGDSYRGNLEAFGQFVRHRRRELGLTQTQLGDRLGWAQERVSVLEHGKYGLPSLPQLYRLADALGLPLDELLPHASIGGESTQPGRSPDLPTPARLRLGQQLATAFDRIRTAEENLREAESQMHRAESLTALIRRQRKDMAAVLASSRDSQTRSRGHRADFTTQIRRHQALG